MVRSTPDGRRMTRVVRRATLQDQDDEMTFWAAQPPSARIAAVEVMRRRVFGGGGDGTGSRLQEFIASFNAHDVRYLIVGGYALAAHGLPRATGDLDAWVWVDADNAERIMAALRDFGFDGLGLTAADFRTPDRVVQLGYPPYRIDILTAVDGVRFDEAWPRRLCVDVGDVSLPVVSREDLVANKLASDRLQDRADVARLLGASEDERD